MSNHRVAPVANPSSRRRPRPKTSTPAAFLETLQASGRYAFKRSEALKALGTSRVALKHALWRLARAGRVAAPRRGFYVIVPPEYRVARCPPADWFIHDLMAYLGRPYYVGLLTAAALHGAAHQAPQEFQVLSDRPLPMIEIGRVRIRFVKKAHLKATPTIRVNTQTGQIHVSTAAATAFDLVRYPEHCGFLSNVATVLHDLAERLDGGALARAAEVAGEVAYAQRLGYLLELVGRAEPTGPLADWVATKAPRIVPLDPSQSMTGAPRNLRWRLAVNDEIEPDQGIA